MAHTQDRSGTVASRVPLEGQPPGDFLQCSCPVLATQWPEAQVGECTWVTQTWG